jgi:hypothetical protein
MKYPLQVSVHDWIGQTVWTEDQGFLCAELEKPEPGKVVLYVNYKPDVDDSLIQSRIELAIDDLGYPAGSRWIGRSSLDVDNVVSLVGIFPITELEQHIQRVESVLDRHFLAVFDGKDHKSVDAMAIAA